jgi:hypothetical protein
MSSKQVKPKAGSRAKLPYTNPQGKMVMLTDKQKQWVDALKGAKTAKELNAATRQIYNISDDNTTRMMMSENMRKPNIVEYLGDRGYQALDVLQQAVTDENARWSDRIAAANSVADRQFGRATQRIEQHSTSVNVSIDLTNTASQETEG